jgi:PAS domain S-box-containing protein
MSTLETSSDKLDETPIGRRVKDRAMNASATILNVDDNDIGRYAKTRMLREAGFNILEAGTGGEALRLAREMAPDLVLLDVQLPDINGIDVCRTLKEDIQTAMMPVLHLSATCVDAFTQAHGLESGADGYLVEPIEPIVLIATINALLRARRAEDKLRASQRSLDDLFENAPVGLRIVDGEGKVVRVNAAEVQLVGLSSSGEYVGRHVSAFHADPLEVNRFVAALAAGEEISERPCDVIASDGSRRHVLISASGFFEAGRLVHSRWFVRDITERTIADAYIQKQTNALARSNADLEDFAYIASHDLKEPLRGINNYAHFLLEDYGDKVGEEGRRMLETLQRLSKRMDSLISSLLEFSRVGRTELAIGETDLNAVVADACESLHGLLEETGAQVRVSQPLPTIRCDRIRTVEIFRNLISNGIKYNQGPQRVVEIGTLAHDQAPAPVRLNLEDVTIYFKDNGIGIPEKHQNNIYRMFTRLHGRDEFGGGTGSGLAIVQKMVERHGGRIHLESQQGEGSTFYITLGSQV